MQYLETDRKPVTEEFFGTKVTDYYRWLEDGSDPKVQEWSKVQNVLTQKVLEDEADSSKYRQELEKVFDVTTFGLPRKLGEKYFWTERQGDQNQTVLYYKVGLGGKQVEVVNPNKINKEGLTSLDYWSVSKSGRMVAYGLSASGDENSTLHIINVNSGESVDAGIPNCRFAHPSWLPDESGFFYSIHPAAGTVPKGEESFHQRIRFHKVGTNPESDAVIFGEGRVKEDSYSLLVSQDGKYLFIGSEHDWTQTEIHVLEVETGNISPLITGIRNKFSPRTVGNKVFLHTNYQADNFMVLVADLDNLPEKIEDWSVFIQESQDNLEYVGTSTDAFFAVYLKDACNYARLYDFDGKQSGTLDIPPLSTLSGFAANRNEREYFYGVSNFYCGQESFRFNPETNKTEPYRKSELSLPESEYEASQEWFRSKDGTKVPMFIFHKKGIRLDGNNPTVLNGYGGFSTSMTPGFLSTWVPFFRRGGVFAVANLRGGGEFGENWHRDGMLDKKMNTFDDFNAAAEHLIKMKLTSPAKLATMGGSNGGLLVAACMVIRPDLYKAIICLVPLLDMVRFPKFLMAKRWIYEYGDPEKEADFKKIMKWSPYHNVVEGQKYPSILFGIANKDTRVDPLHSRKMTALMQYSNKDNVVLLRTEMESGHGPGKSKQKMIEQQADVLAFLDWQLAD